MKAQRFAGLCWLSLLLFFLCSAPIGAQQDWAKLYGDATDQRPHRIRAHGDGVYVLGTTDVGGLRHGFFTKFDPATGNVIWHFRMNRPSDFNDFAWDPIQDVFLLAGGTVNPSSADNRSLLVQVDDLGAAKREREWNFAGREGFTTIKYHPNPPDPNFPFYVLGGKNPDLNAPSSFDNPVLLNVDVLLNDNWEREVLGEFISPGVFQELEAVRGLVTLNNGEVWVLGNGSRVNEGVLLPFNGATGNPVSASNGIYYPDRIDWYDGVQLPNGQVALAGERFGSREAIVMIVDPVRYQPIRGLIFSDVRQFREIHLGDATTNGGADPLYVVGDYKFGPERFNYVHKLDYGFVAGGGLTLSVDWVRHLPATATGFGDPRFYTDAVTQRLHYADSRTEPSVGADQRLFVADVNLNFDVACSADVPSPNQGYSVRPTSFTMAFRTKINGPDVVSISPPTTPLPFVCNDHCIPPNNPCLTSFNVDLDCCEASLLADTTGTVGPYTYDWDLGCDGTVEQSGSSPFYNVTLPAPGTYVVCLTTTDGAGCTATFRDTLVAVDDPPTLSCPDVTVPTDPGVCYARFTPPVVADDDCTDRLFPSCVYSGAVSGSGMIDSFPKGITTVFCRVEDGKGQMATCQFTVTVEDREPPRLVCPPAPAVVAVPGCEAGARVSWQPPTFSDNCPMVTDTSSHQPGDFFGCGTTRVTYTVTDMAGLTNTCSFPVRVNCLCARLDSALISCGAIDTTFDFSFNVVDLTGATPSDCSVVLTAPQGTVNLLSYVQTGTHVTGTLSIPAAPVPTTINLLASTTCRCPSGDSLTCNLPLNLATPCCREIAIDSAARCRTEPQVTIDLLNCTNLFDVRQVRYYVGDAPCGPGTALQLIQVSQDCRPLTLAPAFHNADVCVYAEVVMGPGAGPCRMLRTDTTRVRLCDPVSCSLAGQTFCYTGSPILPAPLNLTVNDPDTCNYTVQWFDAAGPIVGATGLSYQPPALSLPAGDTTCGRGFTYYAEVTSICGVQTCSATIRLDNEAAPTGEIVLLPPDTNPLCLGEDATLEYRRNCSPPSATWTWEQRTTTTPYVPLTTNGNRNPLYLTNRLFEDHWFRITERNGSCPVDTVEYFLDVVDTLAITSFTAAHSPICNPTQVTMSVDWTGVQAGCQYKVVWYHDGNVVHVETVAAGPRTYQYTPPPGVTLSGNFYVGISTACCEQSVLSPVVTLPPPVELLIAGPCFRCKMDTVRLTGILLNLPPGVTCTYQWYDNGVAIAGATNITLDVDPGYYGPFTLEATCSDGCTRSATYSLLQCGPGAPPNGTDAVVLLRGDVFPNPTEGRVYLDLEKPVRFRTLQLIALDGRVVADFTPGFASSRLDINLGNHPAGAYVLRGLTDENEVLVTKVIRK